MNRKVNINSFWNFCTSRDRVKIRKTEREVVKRSRKILETLIEGGEDYYGITTGFGELESVRIPEPKRKILQENIIVSHAVGSGEMLDPEYVRGAIYLKLLSFLQGNSGVRFLLVEKLTEMLNKNIVPVTYLIGSVGASGDLSPLAHIALPLIGKGDILYRGKIVDAKKILKLKKFTPVKLSYKEGLALINGLQVSASVAALELKRINTLLKSLILIETLFIKALNSRVEPFLKEINELKPFKGQGIVAGILRSLLKGYPSTKKTIQDSYTIRCIPQVLGAVIDTYSDCCEKVEIEMNSVSDNPLVFIKQKTCISGGNFHGEELGLYLDYLDIALACLSAFVERQVNRLLNSKLSHLPPFLIKESGLNSGYMLTQYLVASLATENKILASPASIHSVPTSADQEDFVSMCANAAKKTIAIRKNLLQIISVFYMLSVQAFELANPKRSAFDKNLVSLLRSRIKPLKYDREIYPDIHKVSEIIGSGLLLKDFQKRFKKKTL